MFRMVRFRELCHHLLEHMLVGLEEHDPRIDTSTKHGQKMSEVLQIFSGSAAPLAFRDLSRLLGHHMIDSFIGDFLNYILDLHFSSGISPIAISPEGTCNENNLSHTAVQSRQAARLFLGPKTNGYHRAP